MSGWGDNPFEGGADSFDDDGANPFTDQSLDVAAPASSKRAKLKKKSKNKGLGSPGSPTRLSDVGSYHTSRGHVRGDQQPYDESKDTSNVFKSDADRFAAQVDHVSESDLARRERELQDREQQLTQREAGAAHLEKMNTPNYPPFPSFCCIKPWVVHIINEEIPDSFRRQQRIYFIYFHCWVAMLFLNVIGCGMQMRATDVQIEYPLVSLVLSIVYVIVLIPIGFYCRYWSLYVAIRDGSSVRMIFHLVAEFLHVAFSSMLSSGVWKTGGAGFQGALTMRDSGYTFEAMWLFVSAGLWLLDAVISLVCFCYFWYFWRKGGLRFSDASAEAATGIASNKTVQRAALSGAKAGARAQFE